VSARQTIHFSLYLNYTGPAVIAPMSGDVQRKGNIGFLAPIVRDCRRGRAEEPFSECSGVLSVTFFGRMVMVRLLPLVAVLALALIGPGRTQEPKDGKKPLPKPLEKMTVDANELETVFDVEKMAAYFEPNSKDKEKLSENYKIIFSMITKQKMNVAEIGSIVGGWEACFYRATESGKDVLVKRRPLNVNFFDPQANFLKKSEEFEISVFIESQDLDYLVQKGVKKMLIERKD
jgi:hypothetical protein